VHRWAQPCLYVVSISYGSPCSLFSSPRSSDAELPVCSPPPLSLLNFVDILRATRNLALSVTGLFVGHSSSPDPAPFDFHATGLESPAEPWIGWQRIRPRPLKSTSCLTIVKIGMHLHFKGVMERCPRRIAANASLDQRHKGVGCREFRAAAFSVKR
jgi:hypothetical protein